MNYLKHSHVTHRLDRLVARMAKNNFGPIWSFWAFWGEIRVQIANFGPKSSFLDQKSKNLINGQKSYFLRFAQLYFYFFRIFGPLFDIRLIVGVRKMLKITQKPDKKSTVFDGFWTVFSIFSTPTMVWTSKSDSKNYKK